MRRAGQTSIVIINESHERSRDRWFTAEVARHLRSLGYDTLGLETLSNPPATVPQQYLPSFLNYPELPYLSDDDGHYLSEAGYGRLGRQAKALGYRLLPYEDNTRNEPNQNVSQIQQIALREEAQANNLASFVKSHPAAKLLIHVGYSHAAETPRADGQKWMAARLKEKTGIDPLTISQTTCRGGEQNHATSDPALGPTRWNFRSNHRPSNRAVHARKASLAYHGRRQDHYHPPHIATGKGVACDRGPSLR